MVASTLQMFLMAAHAATPRLYGIIDAIDRTRGEAPGVTLHKFAADRTPRWPRE